MSDGFQGRVIGGTQMVVKLKLRGQRAVDGMRRTIHELGLELERLVKTRYLNGLALHRRTGRLARDVNTKFTSTATSETSTTGTKVIYGKAWERGFTIPAREIVPREKQALFWPGAKHPVRKVMQAGRHEAARPFLRPALQQMRPKIRARLVDVELQSMRAR